MIIKWIIDLYYQNMFILIFLYLYRSTLTQLFYVCRFFWFAFFLNFSFGIRVPSMAFQFIKATNKITRERSTSCCADHSWQYFIYRSLFYAVLGIQSLADRSSELCRTLFTQMVNNESHSLHYLLPVKRDTQLFGRLRSATAYPTFRMRTNRFKNSFLPFCLSNYQ